MGAFHGPSLLRMMNGCCSYNERQPYLTTTRESRPMPRVVALYRYPVKGFTPEACESLTVLDEGRITGDRVLSFRFADSAAADSAWVKKYESVVLANTPGLARLAVKFDHRAMRLRIGLDGAALVEAPLDEGGRQRLAAALADYVLGLRSEERRVGKGRRSA